MKKMTLTNSFHGTECVVLVPDGVAATGSEIEAYNWLQGQAERSYYAEDNRNARRVLRRVKNTLCGCADCCCGVVRP